MYVYLVSSEKRSRQCAKRQAYSHARLSGASGTEWRWRNTFYLLVVSLPSPYLNPATQ